MTDDVLIRREGAAGFLSLNRPKAIHALTLDMVHAMTAALLEWETSQMSDKFPKKMRPMNFFSHYFWVVESTFDSNILLSPWWSGRSPPRGPGKPKSP